ncbi:MAG: amino acid adenylation domain-containing protein, partial [Blastocatellia bacterium]
NRRANLLAHLLRRRAVLRESLVAIMLDRSADLIVATLAVLKAGAAYMPVDPAYPLDRTTFMLRDGGVRHCITNDRHVERLNTIVPDVISLDQCQAELEMGPPTAPLYINGPTDVAYCIYTSGSTGRPNGVLIQHRNVVRLMTNDRMELKVGVTDVWTMFHSYSFDFAVWEMYGALLYGGVVIVVEDDVRKDPRLFANLIIDEGVTVLSQTPSYFNRLMEPLRSSGYSTLPVRYVLFGAEALQFASLEPFRLEYPEAKLINLYGITETTVHSTYYEVSDEDIKSTASRIGRPLPTTAMYVLDEGLNAIPIRSLGQIYVGGAGLARGYLNRPALTADRFVPDSMSGLSGARLYKSGDLARYDGQGVLEYQGRKDHQVKLRGYRIELQEIESLILRNSGIRQCVVGLRDDWPGDERLVVYVVLSGEARLSGEELRGYLRNSLPEYMLPSAVVQLPELPLTPSGKIDRKALASLDIARTGTGRKYEGPGSPIEEKLVSVWQEVLQTEHIGIADSFFELGGHSLLATQVISRVREVFEVEIPLRDLFERPTIRALAELIGNQNPERLAKWVTRVERRAMASDPPLSFAQQRLWFIDHLMPGSAAYNIGAAFLVSGRLDIFALESGLSEIVRRHEVLRTAFGLAGGQPVQTIGSSVAFELPRVDLTGLAVEERQAVVRRQVGEGAGRTFELRTGPLLRMEMLHTDEEAQVLIVSMHHIVSDDWSIGVLSRELTALYEVYTRGEPSPLPELVIQYADYAVWQREWLNGERVQQELQYWRMQLADAPTLLEFPTDRRRHPVQSYNGAQVPLWFDEALTSRIRELSQREGVTVFMTLLAALQVLLSRHTGASDIVVGTSVAN